MYLIRINNVLINEFFNNNLKFHNLSKNCYDFISKKKFFSNNSSKNFLDFWHSKRTPPWCLVLSYFYVRRLPLRIGYPLALLEKLPLRLSCLVKCVDSLGPAKLPFVVLDIPG
jgi:hypothetical protein